MTVTAYRLALADALSAMFPDAPVGPHPPPTPRGGTGYLRPARERPWMDYRATGATWCNPAVSIDLVLIAPQSLGQSPQAWLWLEDRTVDLQAGLQGAPALSSGHKTPRLLTVGSPGVLDAGTGLLAAEYELSSVFIGV